MIMNTKSASHLSAAVVFPLRRSLAALLLPLLAAGILLLPARAQTVTSAVPGYFNFQGKVANANGTLVGASPNPVNRTVIFRIWDHSTNSATANLVYSEQQVVTITDGEFSVLIGQGSAVSGTPLGYSEAAKGPPTVKIDSASVFGGATRYLGITIDDGNAGTTDPEVTPRQQLVTSAYAFRAKYAESVGSNGASTITTLDSGNVGIGTATPNATLDVNGGFMIRSALTNTSSRPAVGTGRLPAEIGGYSSTSPFQNDGFLRLSAGGGTDANTKSFIDLSGFSTVADMDRNLVFGTGGAERMRINNNGAVMVRGALTNASTRPAVGSSRLAAEIAGYGSGGAGTDDGFLRLSAGGGTTAGSKSFIDLTGYSTVPDMNLNLVFGTGSAERMRIDSNGLVGIGTSAPSRLLHLSAAGDPEFGLQSTTSGGRLWTFMSTSTSPYAGLFQLIDRSANAARMVIDASGNVGIGTYSPGSGTFGKGRLSVDGNIVLRGEGGGNSWSNQRLLFGGDGTGYALSIGSVNNAGALSTTAMTVLDNGRVGIGTQTPTYPLTIIGGFNNGGFSGTYLNISAYGGPVTHGTHSVSLYANGTILAGNSVIAISDERVKSILGRSNSAADLATLMQVEVTDYRYKDTVAKGNGSAKKVIAQQVEKIFPQAVRQVTDVIPDIYQPAKTDGDWIALATDLKPGERVKLLTDDSDKIYDVAEVKTGRFRTTERPKGEKIFVYGREVKDFRAVDYDAISMLNVSATQELKREKDAEVAALRAENAALRDRLAAQGGRIAKLEAKDRARDAKFAAIEKLLQANQTVMASPAKYSPANGQE